ncbi:hypothetical protein [Streptomyces morookaense]|uniref:hypothetical protein n=1 Tax=Streptomyces morookaense TaxID=1970 RepID=UPI00198DE5B6|nr:hypothetical protein [Streptomyces morookaense]GHF06542.1 hypothetical protein GCM10010359_04500 [Streptomyces morookaense]
MLVPGDLAGPAHCRAVIAKAVDEGFATHTLPLEEGPQAYKTFQAKEDGMVKALLNP